MVFINILVYSYNSIMKECINPDTAEVNINNICFIQGFDRPMLDNKKYYRIDLVNKTYLIINEEDYNKIKQTKNARV